MSLSFKLKILSAGSLVLDILPRFLPDEGKDLASSIISEGRLTESPEFYIYLGGSVGNTGVALSSLGVPVRLMSKIGDDQIGKVVSALCSSVKADLDIKEEKGQKTTASIALAIPGRDKSTIHQRGASQLLNAKDFTVDTFKNVDLFTLGYPTSMKFLYSNKGEELIKIMALAKSVGVITSMDTSLPDLKAEPGKIDWSPILDNLLPYVDIFMPSLEEAIFMADRKRYTSLITKVGEKELLPFISNKEIRELGKDAIRRGAKIVLIKCGTMGMYLRTACASFLSSEWQNRELWSVPYVPTEVVSTTGAGDTAIAGFLCGISALFPPDKALSLASYTSSLCVSSYDTCSKIKDAEILISKLESSKRCDYVPDSSYWVESKTEGIFLGKDDLTK